MRVCLVRVSIPSALFGSLLRKVERFLNFVFRRKEPDPLEKVGGARDELAAETPDVVVAHRVGHDRLAVARPPRGGVAIAAVVLHLRGELISAF